MPQAESRTPPRSCFTRRLGLPALCLPALCLLIAACTPPPAVVDSPSTGTRATGVKSTDATRTATTKTETRAAKAKSALPKAPQGITVIDPARPEQAAQRHRLELQQRPEIAIASSEVGYYLDNLQARLLQKSLNPGISFSRTADVITVKISGIETFDRNSYRLKAEVETALAPLVEVLVEYDKTRVRIAGHTDDSGPAEYNQKLSEQRAFSLARLLIDAGVDPRRIAAIGFGESQPLQPNNSAAARSANRRLELRIEPVIADDT